MLVLVLPTLAGLIFLGVAISAWLIFRPETRERPEQPPRPPHLRRPRVTPAKPEALEKRLSARPRSRP